MGKNQTSGAQGPEKRPATGTFATFHCERDSLHRACWLRLAPTTQTFAPWQTVYDYYRQWTKGGLWQRIHNHLRDEVRRQAGKKPAPTAAIMDSQSVKIADQGGERGYDAGKKVTGRKRHILVDTLGLILGLFITPADVQDRDGARGLLASVVYTLGRLQVIWADAGYLGELVAWVKHLRPFGGLRLEVVKRPEQRKGFHVVRKRWIVERTFGWLMKCRRLVRDYEHKTQHAEAMIHICMIALMLRRLEKSGKK
jgi:putative transposase